LSGYFEIGVSGESGAPIVIRAAEGELLCSSKTAAQNIVNVSGSYLDAAPGLRAHSAATGGYASKARAT
jgi:hypothetical protein